MEQVELGTWLIQYNESTESLRVLINNEYLLELTSENIEDVLDTMENAASEDLTAVLTIQPMIEQVLIKAHSAKEQILIPGIVEDSTEYSETKLNYTLNDNDLTAFYAGDVEDVEFDFGTSHDALSLYHELLDHPAAQRMM